MIGACLQGSSPRVQNSVRFSRAHIQASPRYWRPLHGLVHTALGRVALRSKLLFVFIADNFVWSWTALLWNIMGSARPKLAPRWPPLSSGSFCAPPTQPPKNVLPSITLDIHWMALLPIWGRPRLKLGVQSGGHTEVRDVEVWEQHFGQTNPMQWCMYLKKSNSTPRHAPRHTWVVTCAARNLYFSSLEAPHSFRRVKAKDQHTEITYWACFLTKEKLWKYNLRNYNQHLKNSTTKKDHNLKDS